MKFPTRYYILTTILLTISTLTLAQRPGRVEGEIKNEDVVVEKNRKIELPAANRIFDKVASPKYDASQRKLEYQFVERKLNIPPTKFSPTATAYETPNKKEEAGYENYVRVGVGNYARYYGEAFLTKANDDGTQVGLTFKHNSTAFGAVDFNNSANAEQHAKVFGKYLTQNFKLSGAVLFDREAFRFYGYKQRPNVDVPEDTIRQILNKYGLEGSIENTNKEALIDYTLSTKATYLTDRFAASELDWGTKMRAGFGITDNFISYLDAAAYISQRVDGPNGTKNNRNLFRVRPTFLYKNAFLNVTAGINVVTETDNANGLNRTKGFPTINVDVMPLGGLHFFGGYDGDIIRNTLTSFLGENRWLRPQIKLLNTEKAGEIYAGVKGDLGKGFQFEGKFSVGRYNNFYVFQNAKPDTSKFVVQYDSLKTIKTTNFSGQVNYQYEDRWHSFLKLDFYTYGLSNSNLESPWHRPKMAVTWSNTVIFKKKLIISTDFYYLTGISGKNFVTNEVVKLPNILDLNTKFTYQLTDRFSAFVSLNNLLGKNYQRYTYYKTQGLNFLVGMSFSF